MGQRSSSTQKTAGSSLTPAPRDTLEQRCACGRPAVGTGECLECGKKRRSLLRSSINQAEPSSVPLIVHEVLSSPGRALEPATRTLLETSFGHDFSRVRVHSDTKAADSARAVNARAYTVGRDIIFGAGQYAPGTGKGRSILAHELTHVVQQRNLVSIPSRQHSINVASAHSILEQEAQERAGAVGQVSSSHGSTRRTLQALLLQCVGLGESIIRFFGGGTFSEEELQAYLRFLDENDRIEDDYDSDNKARVIVQRWKLGDSLYILPVRRKILLIKEMLSGYTGTDDERAILDILRGSTDAEFSNILTTVGQQKLKSNFHFAESDRLDALLAARRSARDSEEESSEVFSGKRILQLQKRFTSNAEAANRLNCILIIRDLAPQLFGADPVVAESVRTALGGLRGRDIKMTEAGRVLSELGLVSNSSEIRFDNGNGLREPTAMEASAWDKVIGMVGDVQGWHVFGMAVFNGYHSVTVLVDNRPTGPKVYWADQWRIDPGEDFHQEPGSVSGFRRYERDGFDAIITDLTKNWWNDKAAEGRRWNTSLFIWKFRSRLEVSESP